jgi:hypothetical protein
MSLLDMEEVTRLCASTRAKSTDFALPKRLKPRDRDMADGCG